MSYLEEIYQKVVQDNPGEIEFHQAAAEVLSSVRLVVDTNEKRYRKAAVLERLVEPERVISFRVPWVDDRGQLRINKGWRIQFSSAIGPYKGGLRFHSSVNQANLKQAAFEQVLKNALTSLSIGGAKGGSDFDRRGKSEREIMAFCQSFMQQLYKYTGEDVDIPSADFGAGVVEIGYLYGGYKRLTGAHEGTITGKGVSFGGTWVRPQAAGYGLVYILEEMLRQSGIGLEGKNVVISGSGKVAVYAAEKLMQLGARVVALSDSDGFVYDKNGIRLDVVREIKQEIREGFWGRIKEYADLVPGSVYVEGRGIWSVPCDIALPCAARGEMNRDDVKLLAANGCIAVAEGAIDPLTFSARNSLPGHGILYMPGKAANIGGVVISTLELIQNGGKETWPFEETDEELRRIMGQICRNCADAAKRYGVGGDYLAGANIAAFERVTEALWAQGYV